VYGSARFGQRNGLKSIVFEDKYVTRRESLNSDETRMQLDTPLYEIVCLSIIAFSRQDQHPDSVVHVRSKDRLTLQSMGNPKRVEQIQNVYAEVKMSEEDWTPSCAQRTKRGT
jgi:hypothetical protein